MRIVILSVVLWVLFFPVDVHSSPSLEPDLSVPEVKYFVDYYLSHDRAWVERSFKRMCYYKDIVSKILRRHGLPEELVVLPVLESGYRGDAKSISGAFGYWQFMWVTARRYGLGVSRWVDERADIEKATRAAAKYLSFLYSRFRDWNLVLAAYNAGEGYVEGIIKRTGLKDYWLLCRVGVLDRQVREFVPRFMALLWIYKHRRDLGFGVESCGKLVKINLPAGVDVREFARWLSMDQNLLISLNPFLRRKRIPPWGSHVYLPQRYANRAKLAVRWMVAAKRARALGIEKLKGYWFGYVVRPGDSLWRLSRLFGIDMSVIKVVNRLKGNRLRVGQVLLIPTRRLVASIVSAEPSKGKLLYRVKRGDTIWKLTKVFGVDQRSIVVPEGGFRPGQCVVIKVGSVGERG